VESVKISDLEQAAGVDAQDYVMIVQDGAPKKVLASVLRQYYMPVFQGKTAQSSAAEQVILPDSGYDGLSSVTIPAEGNLLPGNIKSGVSICGVTGTMLAYSIVTNDLSIVPTGTYASSTYYNVDYGVKIGYVADGDILLSMRGGTTTSYENMRFNLASAPAGVSITAATTSGTSTAAGTIFACVLSGISAPVTIGIEMNTINSTNDYVECDITVTEVG
jgi:hypothetical protein